MREGLLRSRPAQVALCGGSALFLLWSVLERFVQALSGCLRSEELRRASIVTSRFLPRQFGRARVRLVEKTTKTTEVVIRDVGAVAV